MINTEQELDRYLTLLRNKIHDKGFTQLEVQEVLGWGRSYISQLLTKQKSLRVEQILAICSVIGVEAREFFAELYEGAPRFGAGQHQPPSSSATLPHQQVQELRPLLEGLAKLLIDKGLITADDLSRAVQEIETVEPF